MITSNSLSVWLQIIETVGITQNFVFMSSQLVKCFQTKKHDSIEIKNVSQKDVRIIASVIGCLRQPMTVQKNRWQAKNLSAAAIFSHFHHIEVGSVVWITLLDSEISTIDSLLENKRERKLFRKAFSWYLWYS